ncbi:VOC family protein [Schaalia suimastitidis]|uniref:VOC family protein n=1 Tax=Schaalia suimastitidis TaxID=121163 RepID=UPI0003FF4588|nr:VOC family protein [Schaalia suimastitidis]
MTHLDKLPHNIDLGAVRLRVNAIAAVYDFYTRGIGLSEIGRHGHDIVLGLEKRPILILEEDHTLRRPSPREAGLFHVAILFPTQAVLAAHLASALAKYRQHYVGPGDHLVSQAFYFTDPEGNGVELYWDRPRQEWQWKNGLVVMDTLHIDAAAFIREHLNDDEIRQAIRPDLAEWSQSSLAHVGHVHLQVGDTKTAHAFYVDTLGFDLTARLGNSAIFVSAGGYHHHMAMNTWNSAGASRRHDTLGLANIDLFLPEADSIAALEDRLSYAGVAYQRGDGQLTVYDPWNNQLSIRQGVQGEALVG